jgi:hypothetical protein
MWEQVPVTATFLPPCVHVNTVATRSCPVGTGPEGETEGRKGEQETRRERTCQQQRYARAWGGGTSIAVPHMFTPEKGESGTGIGRDGLAIGVG